MGTVTSVGSGSYESGSTWDSGARAGNADDVVIASGHNVTLAQDEQANSLTIESGGTLTITGATRKIRIDSENSSGFAAKIDGAIVESGGGKLQLDIETPATTTIDIVPSSGNVHHLRLNHASANVFYSGNSTITGNLNVTLGTLNCSNSAGSFTVAGTTTVGPNSGAADQATLTCGDATMSLGAAVTSGYALDVKRGGTFDGGSGTHTSGALKVTTDSNADAKLDLTSGTHTITAEYTSENRFFELTTGTVTHSNGTIILDDAVTAEIQWTATTGDNGPYNLTLNDSGMTVSARSALTILNNFTLTAGTYTTNSPGGGADMDLTVVNGRTYVQGGTLNCNSSTISLKSGVNNNLFGLYVSIGTFNGGTGTHTIGGIRVSGGTLTLTSGNTTINAGETTSSAGAIYISGSPTVNTSNGTVIIDSSSTLQFLLYNSNLTLHNLTINSGSTTRLWQPTSDGSGTELLTLTGDLTINGALDTDFSSQDDVDLTVTGAIDVASGGALTCNSSAVQCNGLRTTGGTVNLPDASGSFTVKGTEFSGYGIYDRVGSGNIVHNGGTVTWDIGGMSTMYALSTFNNITTATSGTTLRWFSALTLAGDLTVAANTNVNEHASAGGAFTVSGDVDVSGTLGNSDAYSAYSFGSLTINSGGTYSATSGTTTITDEGDGSGGTAGYAWYNVSGTYTHNNGTVKFTGANDTDIREDAFYDVIILGNTSSVDFYIRQKDNESSSSGHIKIFNNLDIQRGGFSRAKPANELTVFGIVNISSLDSGTAYFGDTSDTGIYNLGAVNIHNGGTFNLSNGANNINSIRNISGTVTQD